MEIKIEDILYVIITMAVPLVLRYISQLVSAKVANTKYENAVNDVYSAVEFVNQTFVDSLKQSGSFDNEAKIIAFEKAKTAALEIMADSTRKWLEKSFIDLDSWFTVQIEAAVKGVKGAAK